MMDLAAGGKPRHFFQKFFNPGSTAVTRGCFHVSLYPPALDLSSATSFLTPSSSTSL